MTHVDIVKRSDNSPTGTESAINKGGDAADADHSTDSAKLSNVNGHSEPTITRSEGSVVQEPIELGSFGSTSIVTYAHMGADAALTDSYEHFQYDKEVEKLPDVRSLRLNDSELMEYQTELRNRLSASPGLRQALIRRVEREHPLAALEHKNGDTFFTLHDLFLESRYSKLSSSKSPNINSRLGPGLVLETPILQSPMTYITPKVNKIFVEHGGVAMGHRWMGKEATLEMIKTYPDRAIAVIGCDPVDENFEIAKEYLQAGAKGVLVDVNISWTEKYTSLLKRISTELEPQVLIAGNVDHPEAVLDLFLAGATVHKDGVGPGGHCKTRHVTPIGRPQASNISICSYMGHLLGMPAIADGGVKSGGRSASLAIALGADFIMKGRIFASTDQGGLERKFFAGDWALGVLGRKMQKYFSNGPYAKWAKLTGYRRHYHGMAEQKFQDRTMKGKKRPGQGYESWVPDTGDLDKMLTDYADEITVGTASVGASNLAELYERAVVHTVTEHYDRESGHRTYS